MSLFSDARPSRRAESSDVKAKEWVLLPSLQRRIVVTFTGGILFLTFSLHFHWQSLTKSLQARIAHTQLAFSNSHFPPRVPACAPFLFFKQLANVDLSGVELTLVRLQGSQLEVQGSVQTPFDWLTLLNQLQQSGFPLSRVHSLSKRRADYLFHVAFRC